MKFRSVLVISYGRSGATLLQGMLNASPGCLVRGENFNFCEGLYRSYTAYVRAREQAQIEQGPDSPESPWYGAANLDAQRYLADLRTLVLQHLSLGIAQGAEPQCVGFKEIRYLKRNLGDTGNSSYADYLKGYFDFLARLMPEPAFIFLTRNHAKVVKDAGEATLAAELKEFEQIATDYAREHAHCHFIDHADVVSNGQALAALFDFLGASYDRAQIATLIGRRRGHEANSGALPDTAVLRVQMHDRPDGVRLCRSDPLPDSVRHGDAFDFCGVVLGPAQERWELGLRDEQNNEWPVTWGLPSPVLGKKMPALPAAQIARFRCAGVPATAGITYRLVLRDKQRRHELALATLSVSGHAGPGAAISRQVAPFIIWTLRRTGGTNLAQALFVGSQGEGLHEPFNRDRVYADVNKQWMTQHDPAALKAALDRICDTGVRIKHCVETVSPELNAMLARSAQERGYRHVFLYRRRSADRLLSLHFARKTGVWGKNKAQDGADFDATLCRPIPVEELIEHQRQCDEQLTITYRQLQAMGARPLAVAFEDVYMGEGSGPRREIAGVLAALGIEPRDRDQFVTDVLTQGEQGTRDNYDRFPRRDELEAQSRLLPGFVPKPLDQSC